MATVDPSAPIPAHFGKPLHTFQGSGPGSFFGSLVAMLTFRKHPFGLWTVTVCENGVTSRDMRQVPNPAVIKNADMAWDDFVAVRSSLTRTIKGFTSSDFNLYVYDLADGSGFGISNANIKGADRLAALIQDEVFKRLLPRLSAAFNAGQPVNFGPIEIDQQGMKWEGNRSHGMPSPTSASTTANSRCSRRAVPRELEVYKIKNMDVLWTLLQQVVGSRRRG